MTEKATETSQSTGGPRPDDPKEPFRLRASPPRVVRLSRKVLAGLAIVTALGIGGALIFALQGRNDGVGPNELFTTQNRPTADELRRLPSDYGDVPQLGPALPGDLGRPIRRAQEEGRPIPSTMAPGPDPAEQRHLAELEAARVSQLFIGTQNRGPSTGAPQPAFGIGAQPIAGAARQTAQDRQLDFLNAPVDRWTVSTDRISPSPSPYTLQAGAMISAALVTGIRSDLPGQITAQVTENVYDSPSGRYLLIPQGSRLIGEYDSGVGFGQRRVLLVWNRLILPGGRSIVLERQPGADAAGFAGLEDGVDHHWWDIAKVAALSTLLNVGAELGRDESNEIAEAIRDGTQDTVGDVGQEIVRRQVGRTPTLTIRPGFPVSVIVTRDLILEPVRE